MAAAGDFVVNSTPIGQSYTPFGPAVAILPDGRAFVAWVAGTPEGFADSVIRGVLLGADGAPAGPDFVVGTTTGFFQFRPAVTALADGRVFVAWESGDPGDGDGTTLRGIVIDPAAPGGTTDFVVNSIRPPVDLPFGPGNQGSVALATRADGGVAAVWTGYDAGDGDGLTIRARLFDADGVPLGEDVVVNTTGAGMQFAPDIVALPDGRLFVTFASFETGALGDVPIRGRIIGADGTPQGADVLLTGTGDRFPNAPDIAVLSDGRMLATWYSSGPITVAPGENPTVEPGTIRGRLLDADGQPIGDAFDINTTPLQTALATPEAVALPDGSVFVAWYSGDGGDGDWGCLRGRLLDAAGRPLGDDMVLNTTPLNLDGNPALAVGPDGRVIVTWSDEGDAGADAVTRALWITPMVGSATADALSGTEGQDMMMGLAGADRLAGAAGNDLLLGGGRQDHAAGGTGDDQMAGGAGADMLVGGAGADTLDGGRGDDVLAGGPGADTFIFAPGSGNDRIDGFDAGDRLVLDAAFGLGTVAALLADRATVAASGVTLQLSAGDTVLLAGLTTTDGLAEAIVLL